MTTQNGSWMWRKLLKLKEIAKSFYLKDIGNGRHTSFWYDKWSDRGVLYDLLGDKGFICLGIRKEATVEEAVCSYRRGNSRREEILNVIEEDLRNLRGKLSDDVEDVSLWRRESGYKGVFSTSETWKLIRERRAKCSWAGGGGLVYSDNTQVYIYGLAGKSQQAVDNGHNRSME